MEASLLNDLCTQTSSEKRASRCNEVFHKKVPRNAILVSGWRQKTGPQEVLEVLSKLRSFNEALGPDWQIGSERLAWKT